MNIKELHREAINLVQLAQKEYEQNNLLEYKRLTTLAYGLEKKAAEFLKDKYEIEPTRSVLYRSAASLAFKCEKYTEAIDLIVEALKGNIFEEIKTELLDLLKQAVGSRTQTIKSNDYLDLLNKNSVSLKLEDRTGKYAGAFVIPHVVDFLRNFNQSYQNYAEAKFIQEIDKDSVHDFEFALNDFKSKSNLLGSNTAFNSFGINITAENSLMDHFNVFTKEFEDMKNNLFTEFKEDVIYPDYEDPIFQERITNKFNDEERRKIFSPVFNSISKSKDYKISITDNEFKAKIKEFKTPTITIKQKLIPPPPAPTEVDADTSLTRKIEQITGTKKKTILIENIKYFEQEFHLNNLESEKKNIYFNEPNVILLVFENNYYRIDDDNYKILVSNKDFDAVLSLYNKSFIQKFNSLLINIEALTEEEMELLSIYQASTVRDW